jgi:ABC-type nitrate/sulfonate/bicarbonate transport system substrate-binding protein
VSRYSARLSELDIPTFGQRPPSRRTLLRGGVSLAAMGGLGAVLAACGSSSKTGTTASASTSAGVPSAGGTVPLLGTVPFQLGWVENVGYMGSYIADSRGYYRRHGVKVDIHPGGPAVSGMPLLVAGKVMIAISDPPTVSSANAKGGAVKIIGAGYQVNPACIMSLASNPIKTPADLKGKKVGVGASDSSEWYAFLAANNIKKSEVTTIPAGFDPTPLAAKQWDGYLAFLNNEPPLFEAKGIKTAVLRFQDYGLPSVNEVYTATETTLKDPAKRKMVVAFMAGEIEGWTVAVANPQLGADLTVKQYGKALALDPKGELLAAQATANVTVSADTKAHGLFYLSPEAITQTIKTLQLSGVKATADMFDTTVLADAYPMVQKAS